MSRRKRVFISRDFGSHHIVSKVVGGERLLGDLEKEHLLEMLERYSAAFFIHIHAFCFLSNHLHLIVTERTEEAARASKEDLLVRYRHLRGPDAEPPVGTPSPGGQMEPDEDGGIERLRRRLGSISRFMQAFKQDFSRWYNKRKRHGRTGCLWSERFYDQILQRGDPELFIRGYVDLNALRAGMVEVPEDYRWCGLGLAARHPARAKRILTPLPEDACSAEWYRVFVYRQGGMEIPGKASIAPDLVASVEAACGRMGRVEKLRYRASGLGEGMVLGSREFMTEVRLALRSGESGPRPFPLKSLMTASVLASP